MPVGTVLGFVARAGVEGATDPEAANDTASGSVLVVAERNVACQLGRTELSGPSGGRPGGDPGRGEPRADPVETVVTISDPTYADGTTGLPRTILDDAPRTSRGAAVSGTRG